MSTIYIKYLFLTDDGKEDKKVKGTKKCIIKKMIKFNDYNKCVLNDEVILRSQQRFISKKHDVYTENINKIALSNNDDKRIDHRIRLVAIHTDIKVKSCNN